MLSFGSGFNILSYMDPSLILFMFIPPLVFESAFNCDWFIFKRQIVNILLLAYPICVICAVFTAIVMKYIIVKDEAFNWYFALLFGFLNSTTDPVAVVSVLKEMGTSKRLQILIEGESLLNDGTALVGYLVFYVSIYLCLELLLGNLGWSSLEHW